MWLVFSAPLGMAFGTTTWALLRGRGGLAGLVLFVLSSTLAGFVGALCAEALGSSQAELVTGMGAAGGAFLADLILVLTLGYGPPAPTAAAARPDRSAIDI